MKTTPRDFIEKWRNGGDERRDAQPFFEDLCRLIDHPTPREADPDHTWFTYEYGADKTSGGKGWADVWKKGFFGWEAKGTHRSLERAYEQLKMYADALENPPLLVVSDLQTIIVHTNFTNTVKSVIRFTIEELADFHTRQILEAVFKHPDTLRPQITRAGLTTEAAQKFSVLATSLRGRGHAALPVAHFLNRLLFSMFAEDIGILPNQLFSRLVESAQAKPELFDARCRELFAAMRKGGDVAFENVDWFNGGLFDDDETLPLTSDELKVLLAASKLDWSNIEPSIFGTLFERGLDPEKRSQLGAHYTDPATIMKIVDPVISAPWMGAWEVEKAAIIREIHGAERRAEKSSQERLDKARRRAEDLGSTGLTAPAPKSPLTVQVPKAARDRFNTFLERLRAFTVLDPACGSGNFLYLALRALKDIEKRVMLEGESLGMGRQFPGVGPKCVKGIEVNTYAAELARITIWIGEIQWMIHNGYGAKKNPILQPLDQIENRDALIGENEHEAAWPAADVIIGNPPFVGGKKLLRELGEAYFGLLRRIYSSRVPATADLVTYWFRKAYEAVSTGEALRVGLVATQSIRAGTNRSVLDAITSTGRVFDAWSDETWVNQGAAVRVSLVCFDARRDGPAALDGTAVPAITSSLGAQTESGFDRAKLVRLLENKGVAFQGPVKVGAFDISGSLAREWLLLPHNANGVGNSLVLRPWANGSDITKRASDSWIIDFGNEMSEHEAAFFEAPFAHVVANVKPKRDANRDAGRRKHWWRLGRSGEDFRQAMRSRQRYIATPRVAKHRLFVWLDKAVLPDSRLYVFACDDDAMFGLLHSRIHEIWTLATCAWHGVGNDPTYNSASCFETFPFPEGLSPDLTGEERVGDPYGGAIANAAQALVVARDRWLNPTEWTDRVAEVVDDFPDRIIPKLSHLLDVRKRTLTNLYNEQPSWLAHLHATLDEAVAAAYGWEWPLSDEEVIARLFKLNTARGKLDGVVDRGMNDGMNNQEPFFPEDHPPTDPAEYDRWLVKLLSEDPDNEEPVVPHEEVMARVRHALREASATKKVSKRRT